MPSRRRSALLVAVLLAAPALVAAQGGAGSGARVESIVVTAPSIRVRTAPSISSLSIDEFDQGTVFPLAPDEYHSKDWVGITVDGRVAFIPRYAVAPRLRQVQSAQPAPARELAVVAQAGAPTPVAPVAPAPARTAIAAAPVAAAALPARVEPAPASIAAAPSTVAPVPVAPSAVVPMAAPPRPAPAVTPVTAEPARTPERTAERVPEKAPQPAAERPALSARRVGIDLTVGLLGSVTPIKTAGLTPTVHVAGVSFLGARYRGVGAYFAPEYGSGGGFRSTMLGGGMSLDLISLHMLRLTALAGYTTYSQTPTAVDTTTAPVTRSLRGASLGGMASMPLFGPVRVAYRGQYVMLQDAGVAVPMTRYSLGLVF